MYNQFTEGTAGPEQDFNARKDIKCCKLSCCNRCTFCARALPKERVKSRGSRLSNNKVSQIKVCESCFLCHSIVLCPKCKQCPKCCTKSACRVQTPKILGNLAKSGSRSENYSNTEGRLCPSLPDPAKSYKVSNSHKLLCQSPQEQLPAGGIASAYRQKCSRTGPQSNIFGFLQPTVPSSKTQQQMEANTRSEQTELLSKGGKVQNGDSGNHQNVPSKRGVGHVSRFQRRLLPHTNTGTIQEIPKISRPGPDLPIQGSALRSVHSAHGVHCIGKGGQANGRKQGYKDPPVPRRLVGESQIPTNLSPAHTDIDQDVPGPRLVGEHREIRAGTQTSLRLRRLPVRSQVRPGQTDSGPVATPSGQNTSSATITGLSGPAAHVPDRSPNSHRETSSPRPTTHETHTVASQKQLENTGILRENYSPTQVSAPSLTMVARGKQCAPRPTFTPNKTCSANLYRRVKRRVGRSLKRIHGKRVVVGAGKQAAHKLSGTQSGFPSLKGVPKSLCKQDSSSGNRQHHSCSLHKQRRRHEIGPTVCPTLENLDLVTCSANLYRRVKRRVGRSLKRIHGKRVVVGAGKQAAHKLSGTQSGFPSLKGVPKSLCKQDSSSGNRQHHSCSLHKQRRHEIGPTVCPTLENLDLVFPASSNSKSPTHPRPSKCDSGQAVQTGPDHPDGVVPPSGSFSKCMQPMAPPSDRSFCHEIQPQAASICVSSSGLSGCRSGCTHSAMGGPGTQKLCATTWTGHQTSGRIRS